MNNNFWICLKTNFSDKQWDSQQHGENCSTSHSNRTVKDMPVKKIDSIYECSDNLCSEGSTDLPHAVSSNLCKKDSTFGCSGDNKILQSMENWPSESKCSTNFKIAGSVPQKKLIEKFVPPRTTHLQTLLPWSTTSTRYMMKKNLGRIPAPQQTNQLEAVKGDAAREHGNTP